jgi:hypothetical protein
MRKGAVVLGKELEEPLVVRPTSETIINHMFAQVSVYNMHSTCIIYLSSAAAVELCVGVLWWSSWSQHQWFHCGLVLMCKGAVVLEARSWRSHWWCGPPVRPSSTTCSSR